jgi:hypothetical protein
MAHYAVLNDDNIVEDVFVGKHEGEDGIDWEQWYSDFLGKECKRTSYHMVGGVHSEGKDPFRKNFAGVGYTYDSNLDAFIPVKPFGSWVLNEETCQWNAPVERPAGRFKWDETTVSWVEDIRNG